jgi:hypothetical protein
MMMMLSSDVVGHMAILGISRISDFLTRRTVGTLVLLVSLMPPSFYASRLIDPRNHPRHQGVGAPPYGRASSQVLN